MSALADIAEVERLVEMGLDRDHAEAVVYDKRLACGRVASVSRAADGCPLVVHEPIPRPEGAVGIKRAWFLIGPNGGWSHHEQPYEVAR